MRPEAKPRSEALGGQTRTGQLIVSVIVSCRNEGGHIARFLDSVLRQDLSGMECEILVVDGESDDNTRAILESYRERDLRVVVLSNPGRYTAKGLNLARAVAKGDIIVRMDAHTEYAPDYVRRCVETLVATGADNVGGPVLTKAESPLQRAVAAAFHSQFSTGGGRFHDPHYEGFVDTVPYGCWWRERLAQYGPFDESLIRNEDDEFNLRILKQGGKIWQSRAIRSWYYPRATIKGLFRQYFQYGFWKVAVIRKHRGVASVRHVVPSLLVLAQLAALLAVGVDWLLESPAAMQVALTVLAATNILYVVANLAASFRVASRAGWSLLPYLPLLFLVYHTSYGLGFLLGTLYFLRGAPADVRSPLFTGLSR